MENKLYSALLFASNKRLFSMNKACQNMIRLDEAQKEKQGFAYVGTVAEAELRAYCDERGIEMAPMLRINVERADLYEWPQIFGAEAG
jgi:hypothetical protein